MNEKRNVSKSATNGSNTANRNREKSKTKPANASFEIKSLAKIAKIIQVSRSKCGRSTGAWKQRWRSDRRGKYCALREDGS